MFLRYRFNFSKFYFLAKNKIPLDRVNCKRNIKGRKPTSICGFKKLFKFVCAIIYSCFVAIFLADLRRIGIPI